MTGVPRASAPFTSSIADGVSVESEVRRGTAPPASLLGCDGPLNYLAWLDYLD